MRQSASIPQLSIWLRQHIGSSLRDYLEVIADEAVQTEIFAKGRGKAMASSFHLVLSPMSRCMVHEFLYAASLPDQSEVRVSPQSAGVDTKEIVHGFFRLVVLSLARNDISLSEPRPYGRA